MLEAIIGAVSGGVVAALISAFVAMRVANKQIVAARHDVRAQIEAAHDVVEKQVAAMEKAEHSARRNQILDEAARPLRDIVSSATAERVRSLDDIQNLHFEWTDTARELDVKGGESLSRVMRELTSVVNDYLPKLRQYVKKEMARSELEHARRGAYHSVRSIIEKARQVRSV